MTEISRAEFGLIEAIRGGGQSPEFQLSVRHQHGEWTIVSSEFPHDDRSKRRGSGVSFNEAWSAMTTLAVDPISPARVGGEK